MTVRERICGGLLQINVKGGFGNQLFQIANGLALAKEYKTPIQFIQQKHQHSDVFASLMSIKFNQEYWFDGKELLEQIPEDHIACRFTIFNEKFFSYRKVILESNHSVVNGYFQSYKYFAACNDFILSEFSRKLNLGSIERHQNSIAIHIRLGDYIKKRANRKIYLTPSYQFLDQAILQLEILTGRKDLELDIFSDDEYTFSKIYESYFRQKNFKYLDYPSDESFRKFANYENMIISNSTFSWWAAWLGGGKVVTPDKWFKKDSNLDFSAADLFPQTWYRIRNE
jgi:hypothetical protein